MFSHIVIFWVKPNKPDAIEQLIDGAEKYLRPIPGVLTFHIGRMVTDGKPTVESSYQVALTTVLASSEAREIYRRHPGHARFKEEICAPNVERYLVYDFE
jgi:hypothetical protein